VCVDTFPVFRYQKTTTKFAKKSVVRIRFRLVHTLKSLSREGGRLAGAQSHHFSFRFLQQAPEQMEHPEEAQAALANQMVSRLMQSVYLTPGDHDVDVRARRIDHAEASNAVGVLFEILHSHAVQSTLVPWFDGNALRMDGTDFFPGALLMGRLFSYVARLIALKHPAADGTLIPVEIDSVSYAALNDDTLYMQNLAAAITRKGFGGVATWTVEAEAYHVSRGVEAFFRGCLSINVDDSSVEPTVYFMGSVAGPRNLFLRGSSDQSNALFGQQSKSFQYHMHPGTRDPGQPVRINKPVDKQSKETRLAYVRAHIWNAKAYFDKRLGPTRKRQRPSGMAAVAGKAGTSGIPSKTVAELEDERDQQRAAQRVRAQAATTSTAPHKAVQISISGMQSFDIYAETPLSEATYDRYVVEQKRVVARLSFLLTEAMKKPSVVVPFVHDATPMKTLSNEALIDKRDNSSPSSALTLEPNSASVTLLERYTTMKTVPIYMNIGSDHRMPLTGTLSNVSEHASNMKLLSRTFREVRRMTTLMYLLWDKEGGEELKRAKDRVSPNESFIRLVNAGRDNNGFVFNSFDPATGYDPKTSSRADAGNDDPFTIEDAKTLCKNLNVIPSFNPKGKSLEQKNEERVKRTLLRVPKLWSSGMETVEDTGRIVGQYAHASAHEVGAHVAGGYLFHRSTMFDRKVFDQWNLLYAKLDIETYDAADVAGLREYLVASAILNAATPGTDAFKRLEGWWDELRDTSLPADGPFEQLVDEQGPSDGAGVNPVAAYDVLINFPRRHWRVKEGRIPVEATSIYQAVRAFRLWRRDTVLANNRRLVAAAERPSITDDLNRDWFTDTFGISPGAYDERTSACGVRANAILTTKQMPNGDYSINPEGATKVWGVMFVNELMLYEFGDTTGYTPENSVMHKVESVYSKSAVGVDGNGIATAKAQFKAVEPHLDSVWKLLAKMSSVGLLNVDAHMGNYMITEYETSASPKKMYAKAIDFDPSYTTVFTKEDLIGSDDKTPNREGWKPLYVLNVLMVLYTLSQDITRAKLYSLLLNANQVEVNDAVYNDGSLYALKTGRADQFRGIVVDTIRALERTPVEQMSVPQRLLAASWRGGFKGMGNIDDLRLPTAFFSNGDIRGALISIAEARNNDKKPKYTKAVVVSKSEAASVEPLSDSDIDAAIAVLRRLDSNVQSSNRQAPKVPTEGATHLTQMEWAMRHNLFVRGFMEPAEFLCRQWSKRQELVYFTLDRTRMVDADDWASTEINSAFISQLLVKMTPMSTREFHSINSLFDHDYKRSIAPTMHHCATIRADGYRVIDLLYDYVFSPTFGKPMGDGKSHAELLPRKPDPNTTLSVQVGMSRWQTWRTHVPGNGRGLLSLPLASDSSP